MSRKHKKLSRTEALARLSTMPKVTLDSPAQPRFGLTAFQHKFDAEQEAERTAPMRAAQTEQSRLLRQLIEQDIPTLYVAGSTFLAATAPSAGDGSQWDGILPESIKATIRRAFSEFEDSIAATGKLTASGKQKLQSLARANLNCDATQGAFWAQAFYLLRAAGELSEVDFVETPTPQVQPTESFDEVLESNDSFSRQGRKNIADAAMRSMSIECKQMYDAFAASILRNFQHELTDDETKHAIEFMQRYNLNFMKPADWDRARVCLVRAGLMKEGLIYPQEALSQAVEDTTVPLSNYEARRDFARRARMIQQ